MLTYLLDPYRSTNIGDTGCSFNLEVGVYSALCLSSDGTLTCSAVNLNGYLGNKNGKFIAGAKNALVLALNPRLDESGLIISAMLLNYHFELVEATFDLSTLFANVNGTLKLQTP